ncbi:cupredoxin domain-containing protein [Alkalicoccobacillus murimartini]|uniref:Plastocyanin n=1 Tax=Alkalicoccobacillus murimartini TaxID=171685 RepID=A0ABT9YK86_9BACI|nr:cytochrome C oxidase subunit II [Alkalicoccobacillus murimartini]MDQ0208279.1 plastocyanin [Alkalicoccobacillus murimartini]
MKLKQMLFILVALFLLVAITACGASGNEESDTNEAAEEVYDEQVVLKANNWDFDQETYEVPAGDVTISLENVEGNHGIAIDGTDVTLNGEGNFNTTLEAGEYTIRCTIPCGAGHAQMVATLVVV